MPLPGLSMDTVVITRRDTSLDAEGNYAGSAVTVFSGSGTWGHASAREQQQAASRGQTLDAYVAVPSGTDVRIGDQVTVRGIPWAVVGITDVRIHQRIALRQGVD